MAMLIDFSAKQDSKCVICIHSIMSINNPIKWSLVLYSFYKLKKKTITIANLRPDGNDNHKIKTNLTS